MVSLLAEMLSMTVAPAIAWSELGGSGTQRSSQISIPTRTDPAIDVPRVLASKRRSVPKGTRTSSRSISGGSVPFAGWNQRFS